MSCSKITEKADEEPEDEESDDTLVVVVKPDGTVAIDQEMFNRVLSEYYIDMLEIECSMYNLTFVNILLIFKSFLWH